MAIKSIETMNVMVFQPQWRNDVVCENDDVDTIKRTHCGFYLEFCDGINVLIGENGVGKTTLLKMIYAASQWSIKQTDTRKTRNFLHYFSNNLDNNEALKRVENKEAYCYYRVSDGEHIFEDNLTFDGIVNYDGWLGLDIQSVFIPTTEMLSHSKGFLALNQKYNMPFDGTQVDIIVNASLPETREIPKAMKGILDKISDIIEGTVIQENDIFYVLKKDGRKVDFSLEAEGLRKLGLLWKLIRNGLLESGSILLWDEPEANLNPELFPVVAEILLELQKNGVQIFLATHSYNFAKYLEIRRIDKNQVVFHNIFKESSQSAGKLSETELFEADMKSDVVRSKSAYKMEELEPNHIMIADNRLLDEVYNL